MRYKLLNNGEGIVLTRQPRLIRGDLTVSFEAAPDGTTALFVSCGKTYCRRLSNGGCTLPSGSLQGVITVSLIHQGEQSQRWSCEALLAQQQDDGSILLTPNDDDLPTKIAALRAENDALREKQSDLENQIDILKKRLDGIIEGYDIT